MAEDVALRMLGFDKIRNFSKLEEFETHLQAFLNSGVKIHVVDGVPRVMFIRQHVDQINGLRIDIYAREHAPPHFHVKGNGVDTSFAIADCALLAGKISQRDEELVRFWYSESKAKLLEVWNATRPGDCPVGPIR